MLTIEATVATSRAVWRDYALKHGAPHAAQADDLWIAFVTAVGVACVHDRAMTKARYQERLAASVDKALLAYPTVAARVAPPQIVR